MLDTLKKLCDISGAAGYEKGILSFIESEIKPFCDKVFYDNMGNLIARHKKSASGVEKIMLCCGCDSAGYIVNYIEENGYLRLSKLGNPGCFGSVYSKITVGGKTDGYIFSEKGTELKDGDYSKLYADIGAKSRDEAQELVKLGDICAFPSEMVRLYGTRIGGRVLSARVGAAILINVIKNIESCGKEIYFAFTVQENLLHRGAKTVAFDIVPDKCICVDVCESMDGIGDSVRGKAVICDGAVILAKGSDFTSNPKLCSELSSVCETLGINSKTCVYPDKSSACTLISKCGKGVISACVCVPVRNADMQAQVLDTEDMQCTKKLMLEYLK